MHLVFTQNLRGLLLLTSLNSLLGMHQDPCLDNIKTLITQTHVLLKEITQLLSPKEFPANHTHYDQLWAQILEKNNALKNNLPHLKDIPEASALKESIDTIEENYKIYKEIQKLLVHKEPLNNLKEMLDALPH
jgi:hypothetical protein